MHRSEVAQFSLCMECGEEIWPERERSFLVSGDDALCYACAAKRGGSYDELHDRWTEAPHLKGLNLSSP